MSIAAINVRNQFVGNITEILTSPVVTEVVVDTPFGRVISIVSTRSVNELGLKVGTKVVALVKATEVSLAKL